MAKAFYRNTGTNQMVFVPVGFFDPGDPLWELVDGGGAGGEVTQAELDALEADTTDVHGVDDFTQLETQDGATHKVADGILDHSGAADPHGDRADTTSKISIHSAASDPHGDRAFATSEVSTHNADTTGVHGRSDMLQLETLTGAQGKVDTHAAAVDPHADRAFTTSSISTHSGAVDPHADQAFTTSSITAHAGAADPHGDRADTTAKIATHSAASDPHGDRAYTDAATFASHTTATREILASNPAYGTPGTRAAFIAALDAAEALGPGTVVRVPMGMTVDVGNGLSLSGYSVQIKGDGASTTITAPNGSTIYASTQTGPVLDFTGYVYPYSFRGRTEPLSNIFIRGSGVADPTKVRSGVKIASMSSAWFHDISITGTGGPCLELAQNTGDACYLNDFDRITLFTPVSAGANDVPWFLANECNGNRFRGFGLRAATHPGAVGVSGAVVITSNATWRTQYALFDAWWFENLWVPSGGTLFALQANGCAIRDTQFFDCLKENDTDVGTSFYRLTAPPTQDWGGNTITGVIHGHETAAVTIDTGVDIRQSRNTVIGPKGYRGNNVTLASGVDHCTVWLTAGLSGSSVLGWTDNSGMTNNRLIDDYNHVEVRPASWTTAGVTTTSGTGTPEGVVVGNIGDVFIRTDGSPSNTTYTKTTFSGLNTGWHPVEVEYMAAATLAGVSQAIPFGTGTGWIFTLTANQTFTSISNGRTGGRLTVIIKQDATGSRTVTWPAVIRWAGGSAPALSTAPNAADVFVFMLDGSNWREVSRSMAT